MRSTDQPALIRELSLGGAPDSGARNLLSLTTTKSRSLAPPPQRVQNRPSLGTPDALVMTILAFFLRSCWRPSACRLRRSAMGRSPHYLREDRTVRIETNLYATATPEGEFVWTGISDSFNPSSAAKAIDAVVKVVVKDLEKEGIF